MNIAGMLNDTNKGNLWMDRKCFESIKFPFNANTKQFITMMRTCECCGKSEKQWNCKWYKNFFCQECVRKSYFDNMAEFMCQSSYEF